MTNSPAPHLRQESISRPADFPSDPLLRDGSFIDANAQDLDGGVSRSSEQRKASNTTETPSRGPDNTPSADSKMKGRVVESVESWLPPGWSVETRVRTSGATAGSTDKYYRHTESGRRFRSRKEVLTFLETGEVGPKRKRGTGTDNSDAKDSPESSAAKKGKKTPVTKTKTFSFDFSDTPVKISWALTDTNTDSWTPFVGDKKVAEPLAQEWTAAFAYLIVGNASKPMP